MRRRAICLTAVAVLAFSPFLSHASQAEQRMLHGVRWTTEGGADTLLVINNPLAEPIDCRLKLYDDSGRLALDHAFAMEPL